MTKINYEKQFIINWEKPFSLIDKDTKKDLFYWTITEDFRILNFWNPIFWKEKEEYNLYYFDQPYNLWIELYNNDQERIEFDWNEFKDLIKTNVWYLVLFKNWKNLNLSKTWKPLANWIIYKSAFDLWDFFKLINEKWIFYYNKELTKRYFKQSEDIFKIEKNNNHYKVIKNDDTFQLYDLNFNIKYDWFIFKSIEVIDKVEIWIWSQGKKKILNINWLENLEFIDFTKDWLWFTFLLSDWNYKQFIINQYDSEALHEWKSFSKVLFNDKLAYKFENWILIDPDTLLQIEK